MLQRTIEVMINFAPPGSDQQKALKGLLRQVRIQVKEGLKDLAVVPETGLLSPYRFRLESGFTNDLKAALTEEGLSIFSIDSRSIEDMSFIDRVTRGGDTRPRRLEIIDTAEVTMEDPTMILKSRPMWGEVAVDLRQPVIRRSNKLNMLEQIRAIERYGARLARRIGTNSIVGCMEDAAVYMQIFLDDADQQEEQGETLRLPDPKKRYSIKGMVRTITRCFDSNQMFAVVGTFPDDTDHRVVLDTQSGYFPYDHIWAMSVIRPLKVRRGYS